MNLIMFMALIKFVYIVSTMLKLAMCDIANKVRRKGYRISPEV